MIDKAEATIAAMPWAGQGRLTIRPDNGHHCFCMLTHSSQGCSSLRWPAPLQEAKDDIGKQHADHVNNVFEAHREL